MFVFLALITEVEVLADAAMPPRSPGDEFTTIVARMGLYGDLRVEAVIEDHTGAEDGSSNLIELVMPTLTRGHEKLPTFK